MRLAVDPRQQFGRFGPENADKLRIDGYRFVAIRRRSRQRSQSLVYRAWVNDRLPVRKLQVEQCRLDGRDPVEHQIDALLIYIGTKAIHIPLTINDRTSNGRVASRRGAVAAMLKHSPDKIDL